ncbi:TetM/TetW/TetO/TetS family tetracycline resistance ribosomal protection protein [Micromonospora sp. CPCC 205371]|nr:TetM/TetW/TetO/TetS family tetracycline resistance ribosomal protection protein [Micromonospora sp. CPCC 205371]
MLRSTLNLGILAHVDAGKTTLSERLLYAAGVIDSPGRVDDGTTRTDSLALERQRGITIRSAVVSLTIRGTAVNLIDTPGHPDFVAEVDRVLGVLDGAVLVISAVEGVQPQTRVLMRALRRLRVPTLLFLNKADRRGADVDRVLAEVERRLGITCVPMTRVERPGARDARAVPCPPDRDRLIQALAGNDDALLAAYVEDEARLTPAVLRRELAAQTARALVHPVYAGSAATGTGVAELMDGLVELLPVVTGDADGPVSGTVFKIERGAAGEKIAYVRMVSGTVRIRDRVHHGPDKVTAISVFEDGEWVRRDAVRASEIGKLWGLTHVRVGDPVGGSGGPGARQHFAPPTLEAVVEPVRHEDHVALRAALAQLSEQDPLINVRTDGAELAVSLYGEVQKEVIQATLADDFGVEVAFHAATPLYLERPAASGEAVELLHGPGNPYLATIGLRVDPAPPGSGVDFRLGVDYRGVPLFVYRNLDEFAGSMAGYVREALRAGPHGWPVSDCVVTMTRSQYSVPDGPPSTRGPLSTAADFRKLTPLVLGQALAAAGTIVCEPMSRVRVDAPAGTLGALLGALSRLSTAVEAPAVRGGEVTVEAVLPAASVPRLQRELPGLTSGEGVLDTTYAGHEPVRGRPPRRRP